MAAPEWNSQDSSIKDSVVDECGWLFKLEVGENKHFILNSLTSNSQLSINLIKTNNLALSNYQNKLKIKILKIQ